MKRLSMWLAVMFAIAVLTAMTISVFAEKGHMMPNGKMMSNDKMMSPKGKEVTMTGKMSCTFCTLSHPTKACGKGCCVHCIKAGDPPMLVDKAGNMYLLTTNEKQVAMMTPARMKMVGGNVTVKGLLVKGKGIQAIFVDSMTKAK